MCVVGEVQAWDQDTSRFPPRIPADRISTDDHPDATGYAAKGSKVESTRLRHMRRLISHHTYLLNSISID